MLLSLKDCRLGAVALNLVIFRLFTHFPSSLSAPPITALLSGISAIVLIFVIFKSAEKLPDGSTAQSLRPSLGIIVTIAATLYISFNLIYATHQASRLIKQISFPSSPLWFVSLFLVAGGLIGALSKKSFSRIHNLFVHLILGTVILMLATTLVGEKIIFPSPFRTDSVYSSLINILKGLLMYSDVLLLLFLPIRASDRKRLTKTVVSACIIGFLINLVFVFALRIRIPEFLTTSGEFPIFLLMKEVYIGRFLQRIDGLILMACAYSAMLYGCFNLIILTNTLGSRIKVFGSRLFLIICAMAVFVVTFIP